MRNWYVSVGFASSVSFAPALSAAGGTSNIGVSSLRPDAVRRNQYLAPRRASGRLLVASIAEDPLRSGGVPIGAASGIEDLPLERIPPRGEPLPEYWARAGIYGIYGADEELKYIAAVDDVAEAIDVHREVLGDENLVYATRMITVDSKDDAPLATLAYNWLVAHTQEGPGAPVGNTDLGSEWRIEPEKQEKQEEVKKETVKPVDGNVYFSPDAKEDDANDEISRIIEEHKVVLFMKGRRDGPRCGFSNSVVGILKKTLGDQFVCVDCLDASRNPGIRQGIKTFSDWPTIPQLYVDGNFMGGSDIVTSLHESGELAAELEKAEVPVLA